MPDSTQVPLVSIVTPSLNMGRFLEETIRSVVEGQDPRTQNLGTDGTFPELSREMENIPSVPGFSVEYLVMDGGSTDGTLDILRRYEGRLRYISAPDRGQADAVNRGFARTTGEIFAFLNADDTYLPGALSAVVEAFRAHPEAGVVYGNAWHVAEDGRRLSRYPVEPFDAGNLARRCFICQPAAFFRRDVFAECGMLDTSLRFSFDYDIWIRIARRYPMVQLDNFLAASRLHSASKTVAETAPAMRETIEMLQRHYRYVPYNWLYGYEHQRLTGQALAADAPRPALSSACLSLALGARYNWRHPFRYCRDILDTARQGLACANRS